MVDVGAHGVAEEDVLVEEGCADDAQGFPSPAAGFQVEGHDGGAGVCVGGEPRGQVDVLQEGEVCVAAEVVERFACHEDALVSVGFV